MIAPIKVEQNNAQQILQINMRAAYLENANIVSWECERKITKKKTS